MLAALLVAVHLLLALSLVSFVLLHRGQGGGLSDMFGGGAAMGLHGSAVVEKNLNKITVVLAVMFFSTNIALVVVL